MLARCMKQSQYLWEIQQQQTIKMALSYVYAKLQSGPSSHVKIQLKYKRSYDQTNKFHQFYQSS